MAAFSSRFGMDLEEAFHAPRIDVSGGETVIAAEKLPAAVHGALAVKFKHAAAPRTAYPLYFACPSAAGRDKKGKNSGVTEVMSPWGDAVAEEAPA